MKNKLKEEIRHAAIGMARGGQTYKTIKETLDAGYGPNSLKKTALYEIIKRVKKGESLEDNRGKFDHKFLRQDELIKAVEADIKEDRRISVRDLAAKHAVSIGTINTVLHRDLGLVKKSARWVPKLLDKDQKAERVRCSKKFLALATNKKINFLNNLVTMDESAVCFHTPETKNQSKQWLKKGTPGPCKARSQASRKKQMVLAFFDKKGMIYTRMVPKGKTVNGEFIVDTLKMFLKQLRRKRPQMVKDDLWFFHWDNAPVHTARNVREFLDKKGIRMIEHAPYSPDLAPADFFLFPKVKGTLAGTTLTPETIQTEWERVTKTISKEQFTRAYQKWVERHEKCVRVAGDYVEKTK